MPEDALEHRAQLSVPLDHPSLPGHFPGNPVVPGVVVLDGVLQLAEQWQGVGMRVGALRQVKFLAPLLPAQTAEVTLRLRASVLEFIVTRAGHTVAQGRFELAAEHCA